MTEEGLWDDVPLSCPRKPGPDGERRAISREQARTIVKEGVGVRVLALRPSQHGGAGAPKPVHPHLLRHARVRQLVRAAKSLPLAQKQAGWSRLRMAGVTIGDDGAREPMRGIAE